MLLKTGSDQKNLALHPTARGASSHWSPESRNIQNTYPKFHVIGTAFTISLVRANETRNSRTDCTYRGIIYVNRIIFLPTFRNNP